ncbi:MAG: nucleoside hydrolase-like domain-containing protein, partial [Planctomycetota bacterium]
PLTWQPENNIAEANVKDDAKLVANNISTNNIRFRTEGNGSVSVRGFHKHGTLEKQQDGGGILLQRAASKDQSSIAKPKVWIYTDMSDPTLEGRNHRGTINDPDDVSAMAAYLLMANEFETLGIVVASTHRDEHHKTPDQAEWANRFFGEAYRKDVKQLNERFGGYPDRVTFVQSCIKQTAEQFSTSRDYRSIDNYPSVGALLEKAKSLEEGERINVLCWGSLTEPAILVSHCLANKQTGILNRLRFVAHWTDSPLHQGTKEHPERVANCREDASACAYMKQQAKSRNITYHECGAIGQHGIVSGSPQGDEYFDQFRSSQLGTIFVEGKYVRGRVDHSDSATYWTLLGKWGISLKDIPSDGGNNPLIELRNEEALRESSLRIHDELLKRSRR